MIAPGRTETIDLNEYISANRGTADFLMTGLIVKIRPKAHQKMLTIALDWWMTGIYATFDYVFKLRQI